MQGGDEDIAVRYSCLSGAAGKVNVVAPGQSSKSRQVPAFANKRRVNWGRVNGNGKQI